MRWWCHERWSAIGPFVVVRDYLPAEEFIGGREKALFCAAAVKENGVLICGISPWHIERIENWHRADGCSYGTCCEYRCEY